MRKHGRLGAIGLVSVVLGLTHPTRALAEEDAEALILQGNHLRQRGDNERAHGYFKRAYEIARTGRTAAQLGLVEMAIQHYLDAEIHLSEALMSSDAWVEKNRRQLEQTRDRGRTHLGRIEVHGAPAGTTVRIEGRPPISVPTDGVLWAPVGHPTLSFIPPSGSELAKEAVVSSPGATSSVDLALPSAPTASVDPRPAALPRESGTNVGHVEAYPNATDVLSGRPTPAPGTDNGQAPGRGARRLIGLVTGGVGIAAGVGGALLLLSGNAKVDAITADGNAPRTYNESNGNYRTLQNAGVTLMITGGAALTTGVVLFLLNREPHQESGGASVSIGVSPAGQIGFQIAGRLP